MIRIGGLQSNQGEKRSVMNQKQAGMSSFGNRASRIMQGYLYGQLKGLIMQPAVRIGILRFCHCYMRHLIFIDGLLLRPTSSLMCTAVVAHVPSEHVHLCSDNCAFVVYYAGGVYNKLRGILIDRMQET